MKRLPSLPGGDLEYAILAAVWDRGTISGRELHTRVGVPRGLVYTTVAKVLDRLHMKGLVARRRAGKAFLFHPDFVQAAQRLGIIRNPACCRLCRPRHNRHTFAVNRLTRWHRERRDVQEWLPHLSVYLGHLGPASTYWYVAGTPALLQTASELVDALGQEGGTH